LNENSQDREQIDSTQHHLSWTRKATDEADFGRELPRHEGRTTQGAEPRRATANFVCNPSGDFSIIKTKDFNEEVCKTTALAPEIGVPVCRHANTVLHQGEAQATILLNGLNGSGMLKINAGIDLA
jgi:hypothetical protein